jgi:phosphatidyl-myo-inositol alpha-mannosyltransferase
VSWQAHWLASELVALGEQVTCFSYGEKPFGAPYGHVRLSYSSRSPFLRRFETALGFARVKKDAFDVLHFHGDDYLCAGSPRRVRTFYGSALYEALHAKKFLRFIRQALFYKLEWISCLRRGTAVGISRLTQRALPLVRKVIPCGVPLSVFSPDGKKSDNPSVLFVGDLDSRKRGRLLLDAFAGVRAALPDAELAVVGPQPCEGGGVRYCGRLGQKELVGKYRSAWVYCCPSSYEGFGVPLIEAMACGTVVVACGCAGVREVVEDGHTGLVCKPDALAETLVRALSEHALRNGLAANGLAYVKKFDMPVVARLYRDLYGRVTGAER